MTRGCTKAQVREEEYEALKQEVHALESFMRPQDAQVLHA